MYRKKRESLHIQDECVTTKKPKAMFQRFVKQWKRLVFKFLFKSIEFLWWIIQVIVTLGGFVYLVLEMLGLR